MSISAKVLTCWRATLRPLTKNKNSFSRCLIIAIAAVLAALGSGCAAIVPLSSALGAVNPSASLQIYNTTELRLQQKNFVVVKSNVVGQSKGFALLGIITMIPARLEVAMTQLNAEADLKPGSTRVLSNLVWEKDSNYYILFSRPRTTIRADVIEFVGDVPAQRASSEAKADAEK
jgi:hypothetical protein